MRAAVVILACVMMLPGAYGQATASAQVDVTLFVDVRDIDVRPVNETLSTDGETPCAGGDLTMSPDGRRMTYWDNVDQVTCVDANVGVDVPAGAQRIDVTFLVSADVAATGSLDARFDNWFAIDGDATPFMDPAGESDERLRTMSAPLSGRGQVDLAWAIRDRGFTTLLPTGLPAPVGTSATINLSDIYVTFPGIDALSAIEVVDQQVHRDEVDQHLRATATVADLDGDQSVVFQISNAWSIDRVEIPDGRVLDLDAFDSREQDGILYLTLPPDVIESFGPGNYTAVFASARALEATSVLVPFIVIIALAPIGTGILATRGAHRFRARAVGSYENTARMLTNAIYLVWAGYAALGAFVFIGRLWPLVVSWPIQVEAALVHGGFVITALAFVILHLSWRRQLDEAMQEELLHKELSNRDLKRSNDELEQFAYIASHDLQEPLRTVARFTQLLERRYGAQLDDDAREFMAYSVDGAQRMQALLNDLLKFSRIGSHGAPMVPVDLNECLHRVVASLDGRIQDTGATVVGDDLPMVLGDARQLEQVLQNLIGNALKFCAPGVAPRVQVRAERDGKWWAIHVDDNGIGIPAEHHERIFTVFQRLHAREAYEGTGIGLAICKKIVERHGGSIRVAPGSTEGTRFTFTLAPA